MEQELKLCGRCKQHLPLDCFGSNPSKKDGLASYCKACRSEYAAAWKQAWEAEHKRVYTGAKSRQSHLEDRKAWYRKNRDRLIEYRRHYVKSHKKQVQDATMQWRTEHPERSRAILKKALLKYRRIHHDRLVERDKAYREAHRERRNECVRARYRNRAAAERQEATARRNSARRDAIAITAKPDTKKAVAEFYKWAATQPIIHCYLCGKALGKGKRQRHVDHIVPLARGGLHVAENLTVLCPRCNMSKGAKLPQEVGLLF